MELYEWQRDIDENYRSDTAKPLGNRDIVGVTLRTPSEDPEAEALSELIFLIARWLDLIDTWESYIDDYQRAMQEVLLSELFTLHLERSHLKETERQKIRALRIDNYENLIESVSNRATSKQLSEMDRQRRNPEPRKIPNV